MLGELIEKQEVVQEKEEGVEIEEFPQIIEEFEMPKLEESLCLWKSSLLRNKRKNLP